MKKVILSLVTFSITLTFTGCAETLWGYVKPGYVIKDPKERAAVAKRRAKWNSVKNNRNERDAYMRAQMRDNYKMLNGNFKDLETY